jgi:hypothetical protein
MTGRAIKVTWGILGRQNEKEMVSVKWIASDGPELVPTTDVSFFLNIDYLQGSKFGRPPPSWRLPDATVGKRGLRKH